MRLILLCITLLLSMQVISSDESSTRTEQVRSLVAEGDHEQLLEFLESNLDLSLKVEAIKWTLRYRQLQLSEKINSEIKGSLELVDSADLLELAVTFNAPRLVQALLGEYQGLANYGWTIPLLRLAAENGSFHAANILLNEGFRDGLFQALVISVLKGHIDLVWLLLDEIDPQKLELAEKARLMESTIFAGQLIVLQKLVDTGISVNSVNSGGIHVAIAVGRPESKNAGNSEWSQHLIYDYLLASGLDECMMHSTFNEENLSQINRYAQEWFKQKVESLNEICSKKK